MLQSAQEAIFVTCHFIQAENMFLKHYCSSSSSILVRLLKIVSNIYLFEPV